jgi:hypothetical protein
MGGDGFNKMIPVGRKIPRSVERADSVTHQVEAGEAILRFLAAAKNALNAVPDDGGFGHTAGLRCLRDFTKQGLGQLE